MGRRVAASDTDADRATSLEERQTSSALSTGCRMTTWRATSDAVTWKTDLAMSKPFVFIVLSWSLL